MTVGKCRACGSTKTVQRWVRRRLKDCLDRWKIRLICTDDYPVYHGAYPIGKHDVGKDEAVHIESNNGRQRHRFARFRRKSIVVSKSEEMIDLTIKLFMHLHVNGEINQLIEELHSSLL